MKRLLYLPILLLFNVGPYSDVVGQDYPVQVQILVQPPYSPYFQDYIIYENKATFILTGQPNISNEPYQVYFAGLVEGDNGVSLRTDDGYRPASPISVPAGGQVILMGGDLEEYFSYDNIILTGVDESEILLGDGLPEGNYTICLTAFDWVTDQQVSPEVPAGCSAPIPVVHIDPPQIMTPACGYDVQAQDPQQVIISWTLPATGIPLQVEYNLEITELYEDQDPNEAFDVLLTPAFFETTTTSNTYVYGLADPELEVGRRYAMRVQVTDPSEQVLFRNNGYSEVCEFTYENLSLFALPVEEEGTTTPIDVNPFPGYLFPISTVTGKLHYKFKGDGSGVDITEDVPMFAQNMLYTTREANNNPQDQEFELSAAEEFSQMYMMKPVFNTSNLSTSGSHPLANTNIKLVSVPLFFVGQYTSGAEGNLIYQHMETISTTTTDEDGNFSFTFMCPEDLGVRRDMIWMVNPGTVDRYGNWQGPESYEGVAYKVLRIIVESPYYCSPETNIVLESWENLELGTQVSYVNSYTIQVQARKIQDERYQQLDVNIEYLPNIEATLKRYTNITGVPVDEGEKEYPTQYPKPLHNQIIAEGKTNSHGIFEVKRLVRHDEHNPLDHYKIVFQTSEYSGEYNYTGNGKYIPPVASSNNHPYTNLGAPTQSVYGFLWNSDHVETVFEDCVVMRPRLPRIYGQVRAKQMPVDMNDAMENFVDNINPQLSVQNAVNLFQPSGAPTLQTTPAFSTQASSAQFNFGGLASMIQQVQNWGQSANLTPIPGAGMVLFSYCTSNMASQHECSIDPERVFEKVYTDADGRYEFKSLWMLEYFQPPKAYVYGPARRVMTKPEGFKYQELPTDAQGDRVLLWGEQLQLNFNLEPDGFVYGWVEDDEGNPAKATVFVDSLTTVETVYDPPWKVLLDVGSQPREIFVLRAPSGTRTLTIVPDDPGLGVAEYSVDIEENSSAFAPQNLGGFIVNTYKHRIKFTVMSAGIPYFDIQSGKTKQIDKPVKNALVKVTNIFSNAPEENTRQSKPPENEIQEVQQIQQAPVLLFSDGTWGYTNADGEVYLNFENNASHFQIEFLPPTDLLLVKKTLSVASEPSLETVDHGVIGLEEALQVMGKVTYGPDSLPLPGGRVFIDLGGEYYSAETSQTGAYLLKGMPQDAPGYHVVAENLTVEGTLLADTKTITPPFPMILDFHLEEFTDFAIETFYDLPVSIQKIEAQGNNFIVDGAFVNLPANENFAPKDPDKRLKFTDVEVTVVQQNNAAVAKPVQDQIDLLETNLELRAYTELIATQLPGEGANKLRVTANDDDQGAVMGKIRLESSSFQFDENYMNLDGEEQSTQNSSWQANMTVSEITQNQGLQLQPAQPAGQMAFMTLFVNQTDELHYFDLQTGSNTLATINAAPYPKRAFNLHNGQGQNFAFKIQDFRAEARKDETFVFSDTVHLATSIFAEQIPLMVPPVLEVNLGMVNVNKDGFEEITGDSPLQFNLEDWEVTCDNWTLNQYSLGIQAPLGELTTSLFTTDIKDIKITNTYFAQPQIDMNQLALGGVIDIKVLSGTTFFGINSSCSSDGQDHWELSVLSDASGPAVSIDALPGMKPGDEIVFDQASVWSNGEQRLEMGAIAQTFEFYNVVKVTPTNLEFLTDGVKLTGMFDLEVPRMSKGTGGFIYRNTPNGIEDEFTGMMLDFEAKGQVNFIASKLAGSQMIEDRLFEARGQVQDEMNPGFLLDVLFRKDAINDSILVFVDPLGQILPVADDESNWFAEITGRMFVDKNLPDLDYPGKGDWDYFRFAGDMEGFVGVEESKKRKNFVCYGDIKAEGEGMDIENISVDFPGIEITYDFPNQRLTGSLEFNQSFSSVTIQGAVNLLADRDGWYFVADGQLEFPGFGSLKAGLGIGDYVIVNINDDKNQFLLHQLSANTYQNQLPNSFLDGFSGFFFTAKKSIPQFDIPEMSFDFAIISAYLGGEAGLNASLWMEFAGPGTELGIGIMAYVEAYLGMESIACTTIEGSIEVVLGVLGVFNVGTGAYSITGCGGITIAGTVIQGALNPLTLECIDAIEASDEVSMSAEIQVSNSGFDASLQMEPCFNENMSSDF